MSNEYAGLVVLKMDQMTHFILRCAGFRRSRKKSSGLLGAISGNLAIVVALFAGIGCLLATSSYIGSTGWRPQRLLESSLLLLASTLWLVAIGFRRKRKVEEIQSRMAVALTRALRTRVLEQAEVSVAQRAAGRSTYPRVSHGLLSVSAEPAFGQPQTRPEPIMEPKCFLPVGLSDIGPLSVDDVDADNDVDVALAPQTEQAACLAQPAADRSRRSTGFQDIIAELNKCRQSLATAQERIRQTNARIRDRNRAAQSLQQGAMVA